MYNYPGRGQPPRTTVFPTTSRHGRLAYLDPATLPPVPDDAAVAGQDAQSVGFRSLSANLLARLGPPIYQPAEPLATSTSSIVLTTSHQPLPVGGAMADSDEQALSNRVRTIYPACPESGDLPNSPALHSRPFVRVFPPAAITQTNPLVLAHSQGPEPGAISRELTRIKHVLWFISTKI